MSVPSLVRFDVNLEFLADISLELLELLVDISLTSFRVASLANLFVVVVE